MYLARALVEAGNIVSVLTCGGTYSYCETMESKGFSPGDSSRMSCVDCLNGCAAIQKQMGLILFTLFSYISPSDCENFKKLVTKTLTKRNINTMYLGVNVGKLALYNFILRNKKNSLDFSDDEWKEYGVYLYNSLLSIYGFSLHVASNTPDTIIAFSPQYSTINPALQYAIQNGIKVIFIESGTSLGDRLGTMRVWDWSVHKLVNPAVSYWKKTQPYRATSNGVKSVVEHYEQLLRGHHFAVYSSSTQGLQFNPASYFGIDQHKKVLLMTLSSFDEAYAAYLIDGFPDEKVKSNVFFSQIEWIQETIKWVSEQPSIFLLIRVHPRDFPNKRESFRSEQSFELEKLLSNTPSNVRVNWPSENISLYQIYRITDLVITGWSITAIEGLILGIPVVAYDRNLPSYPDDIILTGSTRGDYFENIQIGLSAGLSFNNVINGFRWLSYCFVDNTVSISKKISKKEYSKDRIFDRIFEVFSSKIPPTIQKRFDLFGWRVAKDAGEVVNKMLDDDVDAVVFCTLQGRQSSNFDDREIIKNGYEQIIQMFDEQKITLRRVDFSEHPINRPIN
jgi:hypothetical protein